MKTLAMALALAVLALPVLGAQEEKAEEKGPKKAVKAEKQDDARFAAVKKLEGDWYVQNEDGTVAKEVGVRYQVTAARSTVMETLHPGDEKMEMVTVYHMNKAEFVLTHYCAMNNQPRMVADAGIEDGQLAFTCDGSPSNVEKHDDAHMHGLAMTFVDDDTLKLEWSLFQDGKVGKTVAMTFVRKSES